MQNLRLVEVGMNLPEITLLFKQGNLDPLVQNYVQMTFGYLLGERVHNAPGKLLLVFPAVWRTPSVVEFVSVASGHTPVTGHYRKEPGSIFYVASLQVFTHIGEISMSLL